MRVLGIDLGSRRTGLALSDSLGITCSPLEVVEERDTERLLVRIMDVAREQSVDRMVVGLPRPLKGGTNPQMEIVLAFVSELEARTDTPVVTWDERFTSILAERSASRESPADSVAACYMLQDYLEFCARYREEQ